MAPATDPLALDLSAETNKTSRPMITLRIGVGSSDWPRGSGDDVRGHKPLSGALIPRPARHPRTADQFRLDQRPNPSLWLTIRARRAVRGLTDSCARMARVTARAIVESPEGRGAGPRQ